MTDTCRVDMKLDQIRAQDRKLIQPASADDEQKRCLVFVPYDGGSRIPGSSLAPSRILSCLTGSDGLPKRAVGTSLRNLGGINCASAGKQALRVIERTTTRLLQKGVTGLFVGGDHTMTLSLVRAHLSHFKELCVLYLDAHADAEPSPVPRNWSIFHDLARTDRVTLANCGLRYGTDCAHLSRLGVRYVPAQSISCCTLDAVAAELGEVIGGRNVYVSVDIDVLDPAFAPGVGSRVGGGLGTRELLAIVSRILADHHVVGLDIVEYNPLRDHLDMTLYAVLALIDVIADRWSLADGTSESRENSPTDTGVDACQYSR
jgi:proclavaminate amidinohydrolase